MKYTYLKNACFLLAVQFLASCSYLTEDKKDPYMELCTGEAIVDHLDDLFETLNRAKISQKDFEENAISINEKIRQTLEHNITNPTILKEIQAYFSSKKHDFCFILSENGAIGVFSWNTQTTKFPIKNIAFYVKANQVTPTSLYTPPLLYDELVHLQEHIYILGGLENRTETAGLYHLSAFVIDKNGIVEAKIFPNRESYIAIHCNDKRETTCFKLAHRGLPKTICTAIAEQTIDLDTDGAYVF